MISRAVALFLGLFLLANLLGEAFREGFDETNLLLDVRGLPLALARILLLIAAGLLAASGAFPRPGPVRRAATAGATGFLLLVAAANALVFFRLAGRGVLTAELPVPLSLLVVLGAGAVLVSLLRQRPAGRSTITALLGSGALFLAFPVLLMVSLGRTDYRRPGDVAVVFGARAYANGTPSRALADRVRTGVALYRAGLVPRLIFSGGPGDGEVHETESMRRLARSLGVPEHAILLDPDGLSTAHTAANTGPVCEELGMERILAVSHAFHLPRIQVAYRRRGLAVYTVPAEESLPLRQMSWLLIREVAAFWAYWLS